ncbi:MAG: hypothetical protein LBL99_03430 [Holosporaceae bacterium]|jgi:molecular chaperone HscB|nr:hypothetical protein [Holosporaceae bacterium]
MNYFELLGIPVAYKIDEATLTKLYLQKQSRVHPDVSESGREESAALNVAYKALLDPLERAKHFLEVRGITNADELEPQFVSEAFIIREEYSSLKALEDKKNFQNELSRRISELIATLYNLENNLGEFRKNYGFARFIGSFLEKVKADVYGWN